MATPTTVTYAVKTPSTSARVGAPVTAKLIGAGDRSDTPGVVAGQAETVTEADGSFVLSLLPNAAYQQGGTHYLVKISGGPAYAVVVPVSGTPVDLWDIRVDPRTLTPAPAPTPPLYLARAERGSEDGVAPLVDGQVPVEFLPIGGGSVPTSRVVATSGGLQGGGALDEDLTLTPLYGSSAATVCEGNDGRLSDARMPLAHAHPQSDITGLAATLTAKADLVGGKVPQAQIPAIALTNYLGSVASQVAMLALVGQPGDWCNRSDLGTTWQLVADDPTLIGSWQEHEYPDSPVQSVAGRTGAVVLAKGDVGLPNVDNTSDSNKPVSTATQTALNGKATKARFTALVRTAGNIQLNIGTNTWAPLTDTPTVAIAAAAGDLIELTAQQIRQANANIFLDWAVIVSSAVVRYMATMTSIAAGEGNPVLYHSNLPAAGGVWKWVAEAGDIAGGNITVGFAIRNTSGASSLLLASTDNPMQMALENRGPVS